MLRSKVLCSSAPPPSPSPAFIAVGEAVASKDCES
eukprot:COSAG06_NODE_4911_length_3868_cov_1.802865_1_plen_34_part_10